MSDNLPVDSGTQQPSTNSAQLPQFIPSESQINWLEAALSSESEKIIDIAKDCGMERSIWYKWNRDEGFRAWYIAEWNKRVKIMGVELDRIGFRNSKRDYKYWEAMQRRVGNLTTDNNGAAVQINNVIFDKKNSYGL